MSILLVVVVSVLTSLRRVICLILLLSVDARGQGRRVGHGRRAAGGTDRVVIVRRLGRMGIVKGGRGHAGARVVLARGVSSLLGIAGKLLVRRCLGHLRASVHGLVAVVGSRARLSWREVSIVLVGGSGGGRRRLLLLVLVALADEEEDSEGEQAQSSNTSNDTSDNGACGASRGGRGR